MRGGQEGRRGQHIMALGVRVDPMCPSTAGRAAFISGTSSSGDEEASIPGLVVYLLSFSPQGLARGARVPRTSQSTEYGHGSLDDSCTCTWVGLPGRATRHLSWRAVVWEASAMGSSWLSCCCSSPEADSWWGFWFGESCFAWKGRGISCQVEHFTSPHGLWAVV